MDIFPAKVDTPKKAKIYTRTGDKGDAVLFNGERRSKSDPFFEALGEVDELNSAIGVAIAFANPKQTAFISILHKIQQVLLDVGSSIATPLNASTENQLARASFAPATVTQLEKWIDEYDGLIPALTQFILPGGGLCGAHLHLCRTICRRSERSIVRLMQGNPTSVDSNVLRYMNRLSDLLFTLARWVNKEDNKPEPTRSASDI